jgi:hypothetical protein
LGSVGSLSYHRAVSAIVHSSERERQKKHFGRGYNLEYNAITRRFVQGLSQNEFLKSLDVELSGESGTTAAAMIFQALESNTTLEQFRASNNDFCRPGLEFVYQLIESLPRIKGLK